MIRTVWFRLRRWVAGRAEDGDAADGDSDPTAFSLLDASVNYSHGQSDGEAVRELQRANEHASELEDARRENR